MSPAKRVFRIGVVLALPAVVVLLATANHIIGV
jgi:hypothetical protein